VPGRPRGDGHELGGVRRLAAGRGHEDVDHGGAGLPSGGGEPPQLGRDLLEPPWPHAAMLEDLRAEPEVRLVGDDGEHAVGTSLGDEQPRRV
jgi:hypothetical protein